MTDLVTLENELKNRRAYLHFYTNASDEIMRAAVGRELHSRLQDNLPGAEFRALRDGIASVFFVAKNIGDKHGREEAQRKGFQDLKDEARREVTQEIIRRLTEDEE